MKSSYSGGNSGQCVECAPPSAIHGVVPVRDSKDPDGPALVFPSPSFSAFVAGLKDGSLALS
ncbi:DUF397 domain-containing protein [Kitasatospora sp. RB6PN24]|uniref:DUF397 domain-containing protein n=1 Tax=Kitasatospora humi TaxID=2893891 RepID=UPI001E35E276|nr:DUF397 domain-containing protein [Kitasatospora humi]MCC9306702.1 DUF397 domain-containing protein [Kitasatospora humi]